MATIYALCDPTTNEIRYIGKTARSMKYRLATHCSDKRNTHRANWVRSLKPNKPLMVELEVTDDNWIEAEQFWIAYFKGLGARLTNLTTGGEGTIGYKPTIETLLKMSNVQKGNKHGQRYSSTVVDNVFKLRDDNMSFAKIAKITGVSKSQITRLCIARFGNTPKEDTSKRLSTAGLGNKHGLGNTGNKLSDDTKSKISTAMKRYFNGRVQTNI